MNYRFFKDTPSAQFITNFTQEPELRPKTNDIVTFPPNRTKFVITRETPLSSTAFNIVAENGNNIVTEGSNNIITESTLNASFDYFVRQQDTSYDTVSLRGSQDNTLRQLFRL